MAAVRREVVHDPFGRSSGPPRGLTREDRVLLLQETAEALLEGRLPDADARLYTAAALLSWLERGGDLERDHLKVCAPVGSHRTPASIMRSRKRNRHPDEGEASG